MDRRFEEVLNAIDRNKREELGGKKLTPVGLKGEPWSALVETPRFVGTGSNGGSRNNTESGDGLGGGSTDGNGSGRRLNGGNYRTWSNWRFRKLDMPLFDDSHLDGWILRSERYFNFYHISEPDKMEAAVALKVDTLLWFQWENRRRSIMR